MGDLRADLSRELAEKSRPRLAKCEPPSRRERCEDRAARAFRAGVEASGWSQRETARQLGVCERLVRDYLNGARQLPAWVGLALNTDGQLQYLRALVEDAPSANDETEDPRTGTHG